jgi:Transposase domain (DUF772)
MTSDETLAAEAGEIEAFHPLSDGPWIFARASLITTAARSISERARHEFSLDEMIPADHLLRRINVFATAVLADLHEQLKAFYSDIGRPSVDPELMIRMLLVGYCNGIRHERRLCQEVALHLASRRDASDVNSACSTSSSSSGAKHRPIANPPQNLRIRCHRVNLESAELLIQDTSLPLVLQARSRR